MTEERVQKFVEAIESYEDQESLYEMSPEEATAALNAAGNDFTIDEVNEMGKAIATVASGSKVSGELDETSLDNVSGGLSARANIALSGASALCAIGSAGLAIAAVCCW